MTDIEITNAPALVLIPGLLCDEFVFRHQIETLGANYRVIVPKLDGFDSIPAMAADVLARVPGSFALVGYSLGGRIALEVFRQAPERISRIALLDTGVHPCRPGEPAKRHELLALAFEKGMHAVAEAWLPPMVHPDRRGDAALMGALTAMVERRTPDSLRNQTTALLKRPDATPVLALIRCPALVSCGREDAWSPLAQHEMIAGLIRGARLAVIDDAGHFAPAERPAELTRELRIWLSGASDRRTGPRVKG